MHGITKLEAAGTLLDAACEHFLRGDWMTAIHCAGAVEELCGRYAEGSGGKTVPDGLWEGHDLTAIVPDKAAFIKGINYYRDWLKHTSKDHEAVVEIEDWHAFFSVQRAIIAYGRLLESGAVPPRPSITPVGEWFLANCKRIETQLGLLPE